MSDEPTELPDPDEIPEPPEGFQDEHRIPGVGTPDEVKKVLDGAEDDTEAE